jgi:hypothetical protein
MHVIIFVQCLFTVYHPIKMINLLFHAFHSTKYFSCSFLGHLLSFCVGSLACSIHIKILQQTTLSVRMLL